MKTKAVHVGWGLLCWVWSGLALAQTDTAARAAVPCPPLLDRTVLRLQDEQPQSLCQYAGQVILVVNTASRCGYTGQYAGLEALFTRHRARGFVVLGFPSNDFAQEPGSAREIADFCANTFGVRFPMFSKTVVRGPQASPLYADLARLSGAPPRWNFHKYLIARDGRTVKAYASQVAPQDATLLRDIEQALAK
ncbi:glutathione peroxidase [Aquabacterium fontiphilum]|uniref:glutathione peroxidase n=1 Tax=Aquabacterium fontiphilum TaxID=450365 RepID=UPI001377D3E0|nr:glutathione peroxidase [Aquabacterium fontiphilum]NBD19285.1 glutathione peroxidase [Aquabacterium fontiphilum]